MASWQRNRETTTLSKSPAAFTLVECLVALTLLAISGAVLLHATEATLATVDSQYEQMVAGGVGRQLMEEICARRYHDASTDALSTGLGPGLWELAGDGRSRFDDVDDFHGYRAAPLEDLWGQPLGREDDAGGLRPSQMWVPTHLMQHWEVVVQIHYMDPDNPAVRLPAGEVSAYRRIRITIKKRVESGGAIRLARLERLVVYSGIEQW